KRRVPGNSTPAPNIMSMKYRQIPTKLSIHAGTSITATISPLPNKSNTNDGPSASTLNVCSNLSKSQGKEKRNLFVNPTYTCSRFKLVSKSKTVSTAFDTTEEMPFTAERTPPNVPATRRRS